MAKIKIKNNKELNKLFPNRVENSLKTSLHQDDREHFIKTLIALSKN